MLRELTPVSGRLYPCAIVAAITLGFLSTSVMAAPTRLVYTSAFNQYRPHDDPAVQSWRQANETVTRIGGWRVYLKESQTKDTQTPAPAESKQTEAASPQKPSTDAPKPAVDPHAGHRK